MSQIALLELTPTALAESYFLYIKFPPESVSKNCKALVQVACAPASPSCSKVPQPGAPDLKVRGISLQEEGDGIIFPTAAPQQWVDIGASPEGSDSSRQRGKEAGAPRFPGKLPHLTLRSSLHGRLRKLLSSSPWSPGKGRSSIFDARQTATASARELLYHTPQETEHLSADGQPAFGRSLIRDAQRGGCCQGSTSGEHMPRICALRLDGHPPCTSRNREFDGVRQFSLVGIAPVSGHETEVTVLLDTGADCNAMTRSYAQSLGFRIPENGQGIYVNGIGQKRVESLATVKLLLHTRCKPEKKRFYSFHVVEDDDLAGHVVIAGMPLIIAVDHLQLRSCVKCGIP